MCTFVVKQACIQAYTPFHGVPYKPYCVYNEMHLIAVVVTAETVVSFRVAAAVLVPLGNVIVVFVGADVARQVLLQQGTLGTEMGELL